MKRTAKEPPSGGSFAVVYPLGVVSKGGGRSPRRPPKRHPVGGPFCYSSSEGAKLSLAVRPGIIKRKKERSRRKAIFTIPPAAAGGIYIYLPRQREVYIFISRGSGGYLFRPRRQARDNLAQKKKGPAGKRSLFTPPPPGGGIIKVKKERPSGQTIFIHPTPARGWDN